MMKSKDEWINEIVVRCKEVMQSKGHQYSIEVKGHQYDDIMFAGLDAVLGRIISKAIRLNNQLKGKEAKFTSYKDKPFDDFIDLINHCFIALIDIQDGWYAGWDNGVETESIPMEDVLDETLANHPDFVERREEARREFETCECGTLKYYKTEIDPNGPCPKVVNGKPEHLWIYDRENGGRYCMACRVKQPPKCPPHEWITHEDGPEVCQICGAYKQDICKHKNSVYTDGKCYCSDCGAIMPWHGSDATDY